ncbi:MAG: MlaC/ttg2D family ABC transporter substrate-binding protein [Burkholderiales bacterium]
MSFMTVYPFVFRMLALQHRSAVRHAHWGLTQQPGNPVAPYRPKARMRGLNALLNGEAVKRLITFLCSMLVGVSFSAGAAETTPDQLVKSVSDEVLSVIRTTKDKRQLREAAEQKVLAHFDFRRMTQLAVGKFWREATPAQQKALEDAFRTLLVNTYTASLNVAAIGKETVEIKPVDAKAANDVVVRTTIRSPNRQPILVDYRMSKGPDGWKVYDVIVENLSLVTNYRSSFASEIGRSGIDGLVRALETKNRELAQAG